MNEQMIHIIALKENMIFDLVKENKRLRRTLKAISINEHHDHRASMYASSIARLSLKKGEELK